MSNNLETELPQLVLQTVQWADLQLIEDLRPISAADYEVLSEVREVLLRHGYEDRFGICLLHKHFDVNEGEAALEVSDPVTRVSTISIVPEEQAEEAMETAWKFSSGVDIQAGRKCTVKCRGFGMTGHQRDHECYGI